MADDFYEPDRSWRGKLRRRVVRLQHRRPAPKRLDRPLISFVFDDAPESAACKGRELIEARGLRATYYFAPALAGTATPTGRIMDGEMARELTLAGHEIGCHTFSHLDCGQADEADIERDLDRSAQAFADWGLPSPTTFAYPFGDVSASAKRAVGRRFKLSRALHPGLVHAGTDLNQAPAVGIEGEDGEMLAQWWLDRAAAKSAWVILFSHGVEAAPSRFGMSAAALERLADRALARGFRAVTVAEGAALLGA